MVLNLIDRALYLIEKTKTTNQRQETPCTGAWMLPNSIRESVTLLYENLMSGFRFQNIGFFLCIVLAVAI